MKRDESHRQNNDHAPSEQDTTRRAMGPRGLAGERREGAERRAASEQAGQNDAAAMSLEGAAGSGLDRRRGAGRRLSDFSRAAEEGDLTPEQFAFVMAIEAFKRENNRTFPQWTDVLEIIRLLGYRKTCKSELTLRNVDDFTERADAPSNVRPKGWERRAA